MKILSRGRSIAYLQRLKRTKETGVKEFRVIATWHPNNPGGLKGKWELCF